MQKKPLKLVPMTEIDQNKQDPQDIDPSTYFVHRENFSRSGNQNQKLKNYKCSNRLKTLIKNQYLNNLSTTLQHQQQLFDNSKQNNNSIQQILKKRSITQKYSTTNNNQNFINQNLSFHHNQTTITNEPDDYLNRDKLVAYDFNFDNLQKAYKPTSSNLVSTQNFILLKNSQQQQQNQQNQKAIKSSYKQVVEKDKYYKKEYQQSAQQILQNVILQENQNNQSSTESLQDNSLDSSHLLDSTSISNKKLLQFRAKNFVQHNMDKIQQESFKNHQKNLNKKILKIDNLQNYKKFRPDVTQENIFPTQETLKLQKLFDQNNNERQSYKKYMAQRIITQDFYRFKELEYQLKQQEQHLSLNVRNHNSPQKKLTTVEKCMQKIGIKPVDPLKNYEESEQTSKGNLQLVNAKIGVKTTPRYKPKKMKQKQNPQKYTDSNKFLLNFERRYDLPQNHTNIVNKTQNTDNSIDKKINRSMTQHNQNKNIQLISSFSRPIRSQSQQKSYTTQSNSNNNINQSLNPNNLQSRLDTVTEEQKQDLLSQLQTLKQEIHDYKTLDLQNQDIDSINNSNNNNNINNSNNNNNNIAQYSSTQTTNLSQPHILFKDTIQSSFYSKSPINIPTLPLQKHLQTSPKEKPKSFMLPSEKQIEKNRENNYSMLKKLEKIKQQCVKQNNSINNINSKQNQKDNKQYKLENNQQIKYQKQLREPDILYQQYGKKNSSKKL